MGLTPRKIVGFVGLMGTGKTTASDHLVRCHGFTKVSFKDGLIKELYENFPELLAYFAKSYEVPLENIFQEKPMGVRYLMQNYGTEVRRGDDPDYWTKKWREAADLVEGNVVIDDVRFLNEAAAIKSAGGIIIRLVRPDITLQGTHASEVEQEQIKHDKILVCEKGDFTKLSNFLDYAIAP